MSLAKRYFLAIGFVVVAGSTAGSLLINLGADSSTPSADQASVREANADADPVETIVNDRKGVLIESDGIGMVEHRGEFHALETLADPAVRAQSDNKFIRQFMDQHAIAQRSQPARMLHIIPMADLDRVHAEP